MYHTSQSRVTISGHTLFAYNEARAGGVLWVDRGSLILNETMLANNMVRVGGIMVMDRATVNAHASRLILLTIEQILAYST